MARTKFAAVVLVGLVAIGVLAGCARTPAEQGASARPEVTGSPSPTPSPAPTNTTPTPTSGANANPTATPGSSNSPFGEAIAVTNPEGPAFDPGAPDGEKFLELANQLPGFALVWVDDNRRDYHVGVTHDIDGAIETIRDSIPRGVTVYFHLAEHSEAELCGLRDRMFNDREELMRHGIVLMSGGCGSIDNRVNIGLSPASPEAIAYMEARYPGPVQYSGIGGLALRQVDPPEVVSQTLTAVEETADLALMTCGQRPFSATALDDSAPLSDATGPEDEALQEALEIYVDIYGDLSTLTWIEAERDEFGATFLARRGDTWMEAPVFAGVDGWVPGTIDYCSPRRFTNADSGDANWWPDPAYPAPGSADTEIHVLVMETECANGRSPAGSITPPIASYGPEQLHIQIGVRPVAGGANCPGNPAFPVTVVLPAPIGDRELAGDSDQDR